MIKKVKIASRWVGEGEPVFLIAEVGSNHDHKLAQAKELINVAREAGVDAVKFQLFRAENLYPPSDPLYDVMKANELPQEWVKELSDYARDRGLFFLASPFDVESVDYLAEIGVPAYKWASSETTNLPLLRHAAAKKKPLLLATGMCDLADVSAAVELVRAVGNDNMILLHCASLYPALPSQVNLRAMDTLRDAFQLPVGFSDHTLGYIVAAAAAARGASVIEKHFTLSRKLKGPDHAYALEPDELKQMVRVIRDVEESLGSPVKDILQEERVVGRRESLTAAVNIARGTRITREMLALRRPALGIKPRFLEAVIGLESKMDIEKDEPITWDMVR